MRRTRLSWMAAGAITMLATGSAGHLFAAAGQQQNVEIRVVGGTNGPLPGLGGLTGPLAPMGTGSGLLIGQAIEAEGNGPIPGALVTLSLVGTSPLRVLADGQGRFAFQNLPAGTFSMEVTKAGYVDGGYGRVRPSGPTQPIALAEGERVSNVRIPLWRFAALTGRIIDELGDPVVDATVQALARQTVAGTQKLVNGPADQTDDRGIFRIGMLEPGDYMVAVPAESNSGLQTMFFGGGGGGASFDVVRVASGAASDALREASSQRLGGNTERIGGPAGYDADGTPLAYPTLFYPAETAAAQATVIRLESGDERAGVDIQLQPARTARVTGTIIGPDGPAANISIDLEPAGAEQFMQPIGTVTERSGADGRFAFDAVPVGQYTLRVLHTPRLRLGGGGANAFFSGGGAFEVRSEVRIAGPGAALPLPEEPTLWADVPVAIGNRDVETSISLSEGLRVTGQVEFIGGAQRPEPEDLTRIFLTLDPADGRTAGFDLSTRGRVEETGQFETMAVPPGQYFVRVNNPPQGWTFRGATQGGRDVTDAPLVIENEDIPGIMLTFTDQATELTGSVTDQSGTADSGAVVLIFPTERDRWVNYGSRPRRIRSARVDGRGEFQVANLPAGSYYVAAVRDEVASDWQNTEFLTSLAPDATQVRIDPGQKQSQSLRVVR